MEHRSYPQTYEEWAKLASDVKEKIPDDIGLQSRASWALRIIKEGGEDAADNKRDLVMLAKTYWDFVN